MDNVSIPLRLQSMNLDSARDASVGARQAQAVGPADPRTTASVVLERSAAAQLLMPDGTAE